MIKKQIPSSEKLMTIQELASALNLKEDTVYKFGYKFPDFPVRKVGGSNRYYFSEVIEYLNNRQKTKKTK